MQIFVRQVGGALRTVQVTEDQTIESVREAVCAFEGADASDLRLVCNGVDLEDETCVGECLLENATLEALLRLRGGGKKRKKKNYTKPKKIKHKHKKVPLATLKYYKVDSSGKIIRLRRECTHPMCGPGIFMANHFDRQYCGKCHVTVKFEGDKK